MWEPLHVLIEGPGGSQQGVLAISAVPACFTGLPSSGSEKNIHSGARP